MFETWFLAVRGLMFSALRDLRVLHPVGDEAQDVDLARGQLLQRGCVLLRRPAPRSGSVRARPRPPAATATPRRSRRRRSATTRLSIGVSLARKPHRAGLQDGRDVGVLGGHGQRQHLDARVALEDLPRRLGPEMSGMRTSMSTTSGRSSAASRTPILPPEAWPTTSMPSSADEQRRQARAKQVVVVDHEQSHHGLPRSTRCPSVLDASPIRSLCHPGAQAAPERRIAPGTVRRIGPTVDLDESPGHRRPLSLVYDARRHVQLDERHMGAAPYSRSILRHDINQDEQRITQGQS